jgi:hypothetical protein
VLQEWRSKGYNKLFAWEKIVWNEREFVNYFMCKVYQDSV